MSNENLIPAGRYMARITECVLAKTSNGDPQVAVGLEITAPESQAGKFATYYGSLSATKISKGKNEGKTVAQVTAETLIDVGWDCERFDAKSLGTCVGRDASIVIEHEEDNDGRTRYRVKYLNPPNSGGAAVKDRLTDQEAANVTEKFKGLLLKTKQQRANRPAASSGKPPSNAGDSWEADDYSDLG